MEDIRLYELKKDIKELTIKHNGDFVKIADEIIETYVLNFVHICD